MEHSEQVHDAFPQLKGAVLQPHLNTGQRPSETVVLVWRASGLIKEVLAVDWNLTVARAICRDLDDCSI